MKIQLFHWFKVRFVITMGVTVNKQLISLSLLFLAFLSGQAHGQGLDLCAGANYAALCHSVVGREKSPYVAAEATVNRLISETKQAKSSAARLPHKDSPTCTYVYDEALYSLKESLRSLKSHDIGSFNVKLSAVMSFAEACKDSFEEMGKPFPIAKQNELIKHIASNALHIATFIS
ncbi:pectinesterase inhibitor 12-like [Prunus dulcis]|nr:pectinesterase inhibitor 12-like [Prunus dulcis]